MEQSTNDAAMKDVQIKLDEEECALSMGRRRNANNAVVMDALIKLSAGEYALGTEQSEIAAMEDAIIKFNEEDCAGVMHIVILKTNLLHSPLYMGQHMMTPL